MEDLDDLYIEFANRTKCSTQKARESVDVLWGIISEQPIPIQYRLINQALVYQEKTNPNAASRGPEPRTKKKVRQSEPSDSGRSTKVSGDNARTQWYWYLSPTNWFK